MQEYPTRAARDLSYLIRSSRTGTNGFVDEVGRAVRYINPNLPLANVQTLQDVYDKSLARTSFTLVMLLLRVRWRCCSASPGSTA